MKVAALIFGFILLGSIGLTCVLAALLGWINPGKEITLLVGMFCLLPAIVIWKFDFGRLPLNRRD